MLRLLLLAAFATLLASSPLAQTCTTTWTTERRTNSNGDVFFVWSDGAWESASRWSNGVPGPGDTACVLGPSDERADFDVTSSGTVEVGQLIVGNTTTGPIRVIFNGSATAAGGGRVFGSGRIDGDLTINGPFEVEDAWMSGQLTVEPQGTLIVAQSEANNGNGFTSNLGCASVQNNPLLGPLGLTVNGGRVEIRESVTVCGRVEWNGGTLAVKTDEREGNLTRFNTYAAGGRFAPPGDFDDDGFFRDVTFEVGANTRTLLGGFYRVSGTFDGTSDGDLSFTHNNLTFGDGALILGEDDVTFDVGGSKGLALKVPQTSRRSEYQITSEGGEIVNAGLLRFPSTGRTFRGATIRSSGTVQVEGSARATFAAGADLIIEPDGALLLTDVAGRGNRRLEATGGFSPSGEERLVLRGRLVEAGDGAADAIGLPIDVEGGRFEGTSGVLRITGGGTLRDAVVDVAEDAFIALGTPSTRSAQTYTVHGSLTGSTGGEGGFRFDGALFEPTTVEIDGAVRFDVDGAGLQLGPTSGSGRVTLAPTTEGGSLVNEGRLSTGRVGLRIEGLAVRNEETFTVRGQYTFTDGAEVTNPVDGTLVFEGVNAVRNEDGSRFINEGLAVVRGTLGSQFQGTLVSRPGSEIRADLTGSGSVNFQRADSVVFNSPGVTLSGRGRFSFNPNDPFLPGTLSPGSPEAPFDTLRTGAFVRFTPTSRFVVDLSPDATDYVDAQNRFELDGTLVVRTQDGFVPAVGDEFVIGRGTSTQTPLGSFDTVTSEGGRGPTFEVDTSRPGELVVRVAGAAPSSALAQAADAGDTRVEVADTSPFRIGDRVVIGAGTANAETRTVVAFGSLVLNEPLALAHAAGEAVAVIGAPVAGGDAPDVEHAIEIGLPYPNPTAGRATVPVTLANGGPLRVAVYDLLGREVAVPYDGLAGAGPLSVEIDGRLAPGVYLIRVEGTDVQASRRLTVTR